MPMTVTKDCLVILSVAVVISGHRDVRSGPEGYEFEGRIRTAENIPNTIRRTVNRDISPAVAVIVRGNGLVRIQPNAVYDGAARTSGNPPNTATVNRQIGLPVPVIIAVDR